MNKEELVKEVSKKAKVSQKASADVIAATLETIEKMPKRQRFSLERKQNLLRKKLTIKLL